MDFYKTPILLKGYHPIHNPKKDYRTAKTPIPKSKGFTRSDYMAPSSEEVKAWEASEGWIGYLVPEGCHVIDVEDPHAIYVIQHMRLNTPIKGGQFISMKNSKPSSKNSGIKENQQGKSYRTSS